MDRSFARLMRRWSERWLNAGLALLFPPRCAGCGRDREVWCPDCANTLQRLTGHICSQCGFPIRSRGVCSMCSRHPLPLIVRSYARYEGPLARAILQLKYRPNRQMASLMGEWLTELLSREAWPVDLVVPVPLGRDRLRQRGYNQAGLIAGALAKDQYLPFSDRALWRYRETRSQVGLDGIARMRNVQGAFQADSNIVNGQLVLVVDDLFTTGATLSACAQALLKAGVEGVYGLTVGRAHSDFPIA